MNITDISIKRIISIHTHTPTNSAWISTEKHPCYLAYQKKGSYRHVLTEDGRVLSADPETVLFLRAEDRYRVTAIEHGYSTVAAFEAENVPPSFVLLPKDGTFEKMFRELMNCRNQDVTANRLTATGILYEIFGRTLNEMKKEKKDNPGKEVFSAARLYVQEHCMSSEFTLNTLCDALNIKERRLERIFHEYCGKSCWKYVTETRLDAAKRLLETALYPVGTVGAMCGFSDPYYFSRFFKKYVGVSPSDYRAAGKER